MITLYSQKGVRTAAVGNRFAEIAQDILWIDLLNPTPEEIAAVESSEQ